MPFETACPIYTWLATGYILDHLPPTSMSNPSDTHPGKRVTLPSIRDLFRGKVPSYQSASLHKPISADEIMQHPPGEPPSSTLARLRIDDDGNEIPHTRTQSPMPFDPSRTYRVFSISLLFVFLFMCLTTDVWPRHNITLTIYF